MDVRPLEPALYPEAARIITDALLHDPGWLAVGPRRDGHRRFVALGYHRAGLAVMHRYGRPIYGAFRDAELVGVAATFAAGCYYAGFGFEEIGCGRLPRDTTMWFMRRP